MAGLAVLVALLGLGSDLIQDDQVMLTRNPRLHTLANWREIVSSPYWPPPWAEDLWRPITSLLLAAQYQLGAGAAWVFRVVTVLLHAGVALGVFALARRILPLSLATGATLLFVAHPVHVEALALAVGQSELLVAMLVTSVTARYLRLRTTGDGRLRPADWAVLTLGYLAAALCKEHGLLLPALLVLAELFLVSGPLAPRVRQLWTGFAVLAVVGVVVVQARSLIFLGDLVGAFTAEALEGLSIGGRALTMLAVVPEWARLLLWPVRLRADYSPGELTASTGFGAMEALGAVLIVAILAAIWFCRRRVPVVAFGLSWTAIAILPVSNVLVPTSIVLGERTLFLPSVGIVLALGGVAGWIWSWQGARAARARAVVTGVAAVALVAGLGRGAERFSVWRNEQSYVFRTVEDAPRSFRAQRAYGEALFLAGRRAEGIAAYGRAIQYAPPGEVWRVRNDMARRYFEEDQAALAVEQLVASRAEAPAEQETWNYLILGYLNLGDYPTALREADAALARGFSAEVFGDLRALADTAMKAGVPPGAIRVRVVREGGGR